MSEILRFTAPSFETYEEAFGIYVPYSKIEPISYKELSTGIKKSLESKDNCGLAFKVTHSDESKTLIAEFPDFDIFFLEDQTEKKVKAGGGRIYVQSGEESEITVVGNTETLEKFRRQGLGTRRLFVMNALSKARYDIPISSSSNPSSFQRPIWERLVHEEYAETHVWEGTERFKFRN